MAGGKLVRHRKQYDSHVKAYRKHVAGKSLFRGGIPNEKRQIGKYWVRANHIGPPLMTRMKLRYADLKLTSVISLANVFRLNSMFDTDYTYTGHQPLYFDSMCATGTTVGMYSTYRVNAAKIQVTFSNETNAGQYMTLQIYQNNSAGVGNSLNQLRESRNARVKLVPANTAGNSVGKLSLTFDSGQRLGTGYYDDNTLCSYNANPTDVVWCEFQLYTLAGVASAVAQPICVTITYDCSFYELNTNLQN